MSLFDLSDGSSSSLTLDPSGVRAKALIAGSDVNNSLPFARTSPGEQAVASTAISTSGKRPRRLCNRESTGPSQCTTIFFPPMTSTEASRSSSCSAPLNSLAACETCSFAGEPSPSCSECGSSGEGPFWTSDVPGVSGRGLGRAEPAAAHEVAPRTTPANRKGPSFTLHPRVLPSCLSSYGSPDQ